MRRLLPSFHQLLLVARTFTISMIDFCPILLLLVCLEWNVSLISLKINRFLRRIGPGEIQDLILVFELLLKEYGLCRRKEKVDINIDSTGLVCSGDTYQFKAKGYFPNKRGKEGYQLSLCSTNEKFSEVFKSYFRPRQYPFSQSPL